jgi:hypothetical protein
VLLVQRFLQTMQGLKVHLPLGDWGANISAAPNKRSSEPLDVKVEGEDDDRGGLVCAPLSGNGRKATAQFRYPRIASESAMDGRQ